MPKRQTRIIGEETLAASVQRSAVLLAFLISLFALPARAQLHDAEKAATGSALPSETPATFTPVADELDYVRRTVMIPMRDGVKLNTVILIPKGAN